MITPIAALISLQTLQNMLANFGYAAVTMFVMIECLGIPFPGETMLLLASFYAAVDARLQLLLVIVFAAVGAILGDNIGYWIGSTGGRAFITPLRTLLFCETTPSGLCRPIFCATWQQNRLLWTLHNHPPSLDGPPCRSQSHALAYLIKKLNSIIGASVKYVGNGRDRLIASSHERSKVRVPYHVMDAPIITPSSQLYTTRA